VRDCDLEEVHVELATTARIGLVMLAAACLAACGGGGDDGGGASCSVASADATALQQSVQSAYCQGLHSLTLSAAPGSGAPVAGSTRAYVQRQGIDSALSTSNLPVTRTFRSISDLPLPNLTVGFSVSSVLIGGTVHQGYPPGSVQERIRLDGDSVVTEQLTTDGLLFNSVRFVSIESFPLTGRIVDAPLEVRNFQGITQLVANPALLDTNASFLPGSRYLRRHVVRRGDMVTVRGCANTGPGAFVVLAAPEPAHCNAATIEALFPFTTDGVVYQATDGDFQVLQGRRAWVARNPTSGTTPTYVVLIERNGLVTQASLLRDGTPIRFNFGGGVTDFFLYFNQQAADSLQNALTF
jgi:hypothetical protein